MGKLKWKELKRKHIGSDAWRLFSVFAFQMVDRGFKHYSSDAVLHRVRWETSVRAGVSESGYKCQNDLTALYARIFHEEYPWLKGFFRLRKSKYDAMLEE